LEARNTSSPDETSEPGFRVDLFPSVAQTPSSAKPASVSSPSCEELDSCVPRLGVYLATDPPPEGATAAIIMPGGGFIGINVAAANFTANALASKGITAIVLHYRVPAWFLTSWDKEPGGWSGIIDAQRAMALVKANARDWKINPLRIGVLGFSAGGGLAGVLSNNWLLADRAYKAVDLHDRYSDVRPAFAGLLYPGGLNTSECGGNGVKFSFNCSLRGYDGHLLLDVRPNPPPTFIAHAKDDRTVDYEGSMLLDQALDAAGCDYHELTLYEEGNHAFANRCEDLTHPNVPYAGEYDSCGWFNKFMAFLGRVHMI
jgi:acetyl esterase/lipase